MNYFMTNAPGDRSLYRADYEAIADWDSWFKANVAEAIAVNSLKQGLKHDPVRWTSRDFNYKSAQPHKIHIYDYKYDSTDDDSMWRPDGAFYSESHIRGYPEHIVVLEVKTGATVPDISDSQFNRMEEYAHRRDATVYYSFVRFVETGFDLSMHQLAPDGENTKWMTMVPPGTSIPTEHAQDGESSL